MCLPKNLRTKCEVQLKKRNIEESKVVKDLRLHVSKYLTWSVAKRMRKASKVLYLIKWNVRTVVKQGLYKSLTLLLLLYGFTCVRSRIASILALEKFQKKVVKWIAGNRDSEYKMQFWLLNILSLSMFFQKNEIILVAKALIENDSYICKSLKQG